MKAGLPIICALLPTACLAGDPLATLLACRQVPAPEARLACFDRAAAGLTPVAQAPVPLASAASAPSTAASSPAAPALNPQQQFGLNENKLAAQEVAAGTRPAEAKEIAAHIARIEPRGDGHTVYVLDNGQVWRQLALEGDLLVKPGDAVRISRGMLGSFWLATPSTRGCKVTRLR